MRMTKKLALTTLAVLALAAGRTGIGVHTGVSVADPSARAYAGEVKPEELAAEWDKQHDRVLANSAKNYESLYKWCMDKKLSFTAINVRRLVLRYDPGNEEVRKFVGYAKTPGDPWDGTWIRNEARRDQIREEADIEDPKAQKFPEKLAYYDKKVINDWRGLAGKAKKNADADSANADAWKKKMTIAYERVLQVDGSNEDAHKSLDHPKFAGKYVRPEAVPFLKVRDERKQGGQKRAAMPFKAEATDMQGLLPKSGLTGGAAKSEHYVVNTVHGKDVALRLVVWGERTLEDFVEIYGYPAEIKERLPFNRYDVVKDKDELGKVMKAAGWKDADIAYFQKYFGGTSLEPGERVATCSAGADADDHIIHYSGHALALAARNMAIQDVGDPNESVEDWLFESVAYDVTRRLTGTAVTTCGAFGKYGTDIEPNVNKDIWMELAKRQVEYDDDVPLSRLWKCKHENQDLRGPETVKGYAFLQFLFESDVEKGRRFVWTALAQGTPKAVDAVYGIPMDQLDAQYRDWIIKSW